MTSQPRTLSVRLRGLGFAQGNQVKLYGQSYHVDGEPMVITDDLVLVDAIEMKSGERKRIRIPLPVLTIAKESCVNLNVAGLYSRASISR